MRGRGSSPFQRSTLLAGVHLGALSSLAIAQPLFDLLGHNADFFAAHDVDATDVVVFALAVTLVPPLALLVVEVLLGLVDARAQAVLHGAFVGGLVALFVVQAVKKRADLPMSRWILCAVLVTAGAAVAYMKLRPVRMFVSVLGPAPVVILVLFLFFSPVEKFVLPATEEAHGAVKVSSRTPVVVVIFDEFPTTSLMDARHRIDAARYPNFAALAHDSTWLRNDTTVHEGTGGAVPSLMTGIYPHRHTYPILADHPNNVFTLLGPAYFIEAVEPVTHLCPPKLCRSPIISESFRGRISTLFSDTSVVYAHLVVPDDYEDRLPSVSLSWTNFRSSAKKEERGRIANFKRFVDSIKRTHRPTLSLIHIEIPHVPWVLLPNCHQYGDALRVGAAIRGRDTWARSWLVAQAFQRHLLQLQCTDRLLGYLLHHLREKGLYDDTMLVVTADEGASFRPGDHRRATSATNVADIAYIPLFVKRPGQHAPRIDDSNTESIDVVPTIADVLGVHIPWDVDGTSVFDRIRRSRIHMGTAHGIVRARAARLLRMREQTLRKQLALFGSGNGKPGIYGVGPHPELIGHTLRQLSIAAGSGGAAASVSSKLDDVLRDFHPGRDVVPTPIAGTISGPGVGATTDLAVAVNGRVAAVSRTYRAGGGWGYSALAPESAFRGGPNRVDVFTVTAGGGRLTLRRVGGFTP